MNRNIKNVKNVLHLELVRCYVAGASNIPFLNVTSRQSTVRIERPIQWQLLVPRADGGVGIIHEVTMRIKPQFALVH